MTPEQREAAGLYRRSLDAERATGASEHGIARIRGGRAQVYTFRDQSFMRALRNETMLEGDALWGFMGQITRAYAYMATQPESVVRAAQHVPRLLGAQRDHPPP